MSDVQNREPINELDLYDYHLPRERIAQDPLTTRSDARLMVVDRATGAIDHFHVRDLPEILRPADTLVLNNSRVVPARLIGYRNSTRGRWQGLFLRNDESTGIWEVLTKTRGKLQSGETLTVQDRNGRDGMELKVVGRTETGNLLVAPGLPASYVALHAEVNPLLSGAGGEGEPGRLDDLGGSPDPGRSNDPFPWLERFGRVPLPPYIRDGHMVDADVEHYQTVYAKARGSVAAPTAGLHFTESLLAKLDVLGVAITELTLHVGTGTFRPIQTDRLADHRMHQEWGSIEESTADRICKRRAAGGRCIAVGTTSVRVLETAAKENGGKLAAWTGQTDLFIQPPYSFAAVDALMTNFHLPRSSLLVLVSAFASRELALQAYHEAIDQEYRFYSYGDAMLIT